MAPLKRKAKAGPCKKVGRWCGRSGEVKGQCGRRKGPSSASASRGDWPEWEVAAEKEIGNFIAHGTFDLVDISEPMTTGPQNGLRNEKCLFWHHKRSQQTHSHAPSKRDLRANSA